MATLHRALFAWFNVLIFMILLALRLDQKIQWNWFIVFIPLWLYDNFLLIYIVFNMISHCKNPLNRHIVSLQRKVSICNFFFFHSQDIHALHDAILRKNRNMTQYCKEEADNTGNL